MNMQALLFAIFSMAVVAMSDDECSHFIGLPKEEALTRFSAGTQRALRELDFLKTRNMAVVQAFVLYMVGGNDPETMLLSSNCLFKMSLQGRLDRHALWSLNGVLVRIAQKMGLHQDGEILGLPPFESEMRRRIWWQIILMDAKYAIRSGLGHSLLPRHSSTTEPRNLNDADMNPDTTRPLHNRPGPTEMILCQIMYKVAKFLLQTPGLEPIRSLLGELKTGPGDISSQADNEHHSYYRACFKELERDIASLQENYCDASRGCTHQMASVMIKSILDHLRFLSKLPGIQVGSSGLQLDDETLLTVAVMELEIHTSTAIASKSLGFTWFALLNMPLDVLIVVVRRLDRLTDGDLVERAWKQIELTYTLHQELFDMESETNQALAYLILGAWHKHRDGLQEHQYQGSSYPGYIQKIQLGCAVDTSHDTQYAYVPGDPVPNTDILQQNSIGDGVTAPTIGFGMFPLSEW